MRLDKSAVQKRLIPGGKTDLPGQVYLNFVDDTTMKQLIQCT